MRDLQDSLVSGLASRYKVLSELGRGGMAVVFGARDLKHDRDVALKVLRPELTVAVGRDRFAREIRLAAQLAHPNILPLHDSGDIDGYLYYVTPLISEGTLRDRLDTEGQLPIHDAVSIGIAVARALEHAHRHGIVHRDIKPDNIMLQGGAPVVADFGIGKAVDEIDLEVLTQTGLVVGSAAYLSPEQGAGDPKVDGRTDIYSLGCVIYEMLAGEAPFSGPTFQSIVAKRYTQPIPRVSLLRETVSQELEAAIMRAMARMAVDRFPTAGEFADVLVAAAERTSTGRSVIAVADIESLVVLPLKNLSGDPGDEHLSDGLTEELIHRLSKVDNLHVIGRTSSFAFKDTNDDVRTIAERLQVRNILDGSVRRAAKQVRVTVQLISTANDKPLWSERFDRELDDIFQIQDEISESIVATLRGTLLAQRPKRSRSAVSFATWENYLKGRHAWSRRTEHGIEKSLTFLQRAAADDPEFAPPRAGLADAYVTLAVYGARPPNEVIPLANEAVAEALAIDPESAEALTAQACIRAVYDWEWPDAEEVFRQASRKAPNYSMAPHWFAMHCLLPQRRFVEAFVELQRARELDPMSAAIAVSHGVLEYMRGDDKLATQLIQEVLEFENTFALGHYFLGQALENAGDHERAMAAFERAAHETNSSVEVLSAIGHLNAKMNRHSLAAQTIQALHTRSRERYVSPVHVAQVYVGLGDLDEAFSWLERGFECRATELIWLAVRPTWKPLHGDPRYDELIERLRLPSEILGETTGPRSFDR